MGTDRTPCPGGTRYPLLVRGYRGTSTGYRLVPVPAWVPVELLGLQTACRGTRGAKPGNDLARSSHRTQSPIGCVRGRRSPSADLIARVCNREALATPAIEAENGRSRWIACPLSRLQGDCPVAASTNSEVPMPHPSTEGRSTGRPAAFNPSLAGSVRAGRFDVRGGLYAPAPRSPSGRWGQGTHFPSVPQLGELQGPLSPAGFPPTPCTPASCRRGWSRRFHGRCTRSPTTRGPHGD